MPKCIFADVKKYDKSITVKKVRKVETGIVSVTFVQVNVDHIVRPFLQLGSLLCCELLYWGEYE